MRYFEDMVVGAKTRGSRTYKVTREEVIEFASKYDPQPFHLDDEAAKKTYFGRLGSPGLDELRWVKPVYPGDELSVETELIEKRRSKSRPDMGITKSRQTVYNQHGEVVMTMIGNGLIRVRDPSAPFD
jgi:acyl dehydratase